MDNIDELESITLLNLFTIFFLKSFNSSGGIQKFLFPRKERMAAGTDFYTDFLFGTLRFKGRSAGTLDHRFKNFGMDILFHLITSIFYFTNFSRIFKYFYLFSKRTHLLIHRIEEFPIVLSGMQLLQEEFHAFHRVHGLEDFSQKPDAIDIVLVQ